jgi:hypothetical protein
LLKPLFLPLTLFLFWLLTEEITSVQGSIDLLVLLIHDNSYLINVYRFRAFWLDKSTVTCLLWSVQISMNLCVSELLFGVTSVSNMAAADEKLRYCSIENIVKHVTYLWIVSLLSPESCFYWYFPCTQNIWLTAILPVLSKDILLRDTQLWNVIVTW